jgi:hypothetical protein
MARPRYALKMSKFRIGQSVRLRSTVQARGKADGEYRIVGQLAQDNIIHYRVRSSADERDEIVVKESELYDWQTSRTVHRR